MLRCAASMSKLQRSNDDDRLRHSILGPSKTWIIGVEWLQADAHTQQGGPRFGQMGSGYKIRPSSRAAELRKQFNASSRRHCGRGYRRTSRDPTVLLISVVRTVQSPGLCGRSEPEERFYDVVTSVSKLPPKEHRAAEQGNGGQDDVSLERAVGGVSFTRFDDTDTSSRKPERVIVPKSPTSTTFPPLNSLLRGLSTTSASASNYCRVSGHHPQGGEGSSSLTDRNDERQAKRH